jgi:hypothetical protein
VRESKTEASKVRDEDKRQREMEITSRKQGKRQREKRYSITMYSGVHRLGAGIILS